MALAWVLREGAITSALIGASSAAQVTDCIGALVKMDFSAEELRLIDEYARDEKINLWARSSGTE